jgi:hypothetical protein
MATGNSRCWCELCVPRKSFDSIDELTAHMKDATAKREHQVAWKKDKDVPPKLQL